MTGALSDLARNVGVTFNTLVQGAWALLLGRYSGGRDVVFAVPRACRHSHVPGAEGVVGLFLNTLPLRIQMPPEARLGGWLSGIRRQNLALRSVEHTPLSRIREWSEAPFDRPLFESLVAYENHDWAAQLQAQGGRWAGRQFRMLHQAGFPLSLEVSLGRELSIDLCFDEGRFDSQAIDRMLGHYKNLLTGMVSDPDGRISQLPLLADLERRQILVEWNQTATPFPDAQCVHSLFESQARRTPEAIASTFGTESLTYQQLDDLANRLARNLHARGVRRGDLVAVHLERSFELLVAILAILKCGGGYVPLPTDYPVARRRFMLEDSRAVLVISL